MSDRIVEGGIKMKLSTTKLFFVAGAIVFSGVALAQQGLDFGRGEYQSSCATCHGVDGRGNGPVVSYLTSAPSDLTTLSKRYGGAFPTDLVWEMIDGRTSEKIGPHGTREMPIWGADYRAEAIMQGSPKPEWYVRGKIVALIDYLARIQQ